MASKDNNNTSQSTEWRRQILDQVFKGLLVLNGGGAVALLAFLQAVWRDENSDLARIVIRALGILVLGLVFAVFFQSFRYHTSLSFQKGSGKRWLWRWTYLSCLYLSVAFFVAATGYLVFAMLYLIH